jgi:DNA-binding HxlR family transcriptional regulator
MGRGAHNPELCSRFHRASELIGRRWTGAIIFVLLKSECRFATLRAAIPEITDRMLSDRLQELEHEGIVQRTVVPTTPVRVEYALTRKGRGLAAAIDAIKDWAHRWIPADATATRDASAARIQPLSRRRSKDRIRSEADRRP